MKDKRPTGRFAGTRTRALLAAVALMLGVSSASSAPLAEPPVFRSVNGVLDVVMTAWTTSFLDPDGVTGVNGPYYPKTLRYLTCLTKDAKWSLNSGYSCNAAATASPYGGVRLAVKQGDILRIHLKNMLEGFVDETPTHLAENPLLGLNPTNLHTHGLVVEAKANSQASGVPKYGDFVFTSVFSNLHGDPMSVPDAKMHAHGDIVTGGWVDYEIRIPNDHPSGVFYFHPHIHGLSVNQVSGGLSGIITVGDAGGNACIDILCKSTVPESSVRHLILKDLQVLSVDTANITQMQANPAFCNGQVGTFNGWCGSGATPKDKWFFTVNGQLYPSITMSGNEVWRLTNASANVVRDLQLIDTVTQQPIPLQLVSLDGVAVDVPLTAKVGDIINVGLNRFTVVDCSTPANFPKRVVCVKDLIMYPGSRAEVYVSYRDANGAVVGVPNKATAVLRQISYKTGPAGDTWPSVNLASVTFPSTATGPAVTVKATSLSADTVLPAAAPLPPGCKALPAGWSRRIYLGNPNIAGVATPGQDAAGNPVFGLGYEEIDANKQPVPGTFVDISQFDPSKKICLPLADGQGKVEENWELVNLALENHNFHIHQTKLRIVPSQTGTAMPMIWEDSVPLPPATALAGSQPNLKPGAASCTVADYKAGKCTVTKVTILIRFKRVGKFVYHCHILEHEDGGMMQVVEVVPAAK